MNTKVHDISYSAKKMGIATLVAKDDTASLLCNNPSPSYEPSLASSFAMVGRTFLRVKEK